MLIQVWMFMEQLIGINHYNDQKKKDSFKYSRIRFWKLHTIIFSKCILKCILV